MNKTLANVRKSKQSGFSLYIIIFILLLVCVTALFVLSVFRPGQNAPEALNTPQPQESSAAKKALTSLTMKSSSVVVEEKQALQTTTPPESASAKNGVETKEISMRQMLKSAITENAKLISDIKDLNERLKKSSDQNSIYADRIRLLMEELRKKEEERMKMVLDQKDQSEKLSATIKELEVKIADITKQLDENELKKNNDTLKAGLEQAKKDLQKTTELFKENAQQKERLAEEGATIHYNLGNVLFQLRDYENAVTEYKKAQEVLGNDPDIHYNLAIIYDYHLKDPQQAALHYLAYLKLAPDAENAQQVKERLAEKQLQKKFDSTAFPDVSGKMK